MGYIRTHFMVKSWIAPQKNMRFPHQTALNMRHKWFIVLQNLLENNPVLLYSIAELNKTFILDRKYGAKGAKRGISAKYISICMNMQCDVATEYINRYNAWLSIAFRCASALKDTLFLSFGMVGQGCC